MFWLAQQLVGVLICIAAIYAAGLLIYFVWKVFLALLKGIVDATRGVCYHVGRSLGEVMRAFLFVPRWIQAKRLARRFRRSYCS